MKRKVLFMGALLGTLLAAGTVYGAGQRSRSAGTQGLVTLDVYAGISTGLMENRYWTDILKEDLGIVINLVPHNSDILNAMMAAGSLNVDVISLQTADVARAIQAGLILNLDDYRDKLPNVYANAPLMLQYVRDNESNGTGRIYALRDGVSTELNGSRYLDGPYLRWDYYKELGYPEITEPEDYLPVLRKMLDAHPTNDYGQRRYGFALFSDWDGTAMQNANWIVTGHLGKLTPGGFLEVDIATGSIGTLLDDTSTYRRALKLLYNANQMGLVDPNSPSMGFGQQTELSTAGRILFWPGYISGTGRLSTEEEAAGKGYRLVPFKNERIGLSTPAYVGGNQHFAISKDTKNLDKALAYLDYLYSYDGMWNLTHGRRGDKWDLDANGDAYLTDLGKEIQYNNKEHPNGGLKGEGAFYVNFMGLNQIIHPVYKRSINHDVDWPEKDGALITAGDSALDRDWKAKMNAAGDGDYFRNNNMILQVPFAPMNPAPDNIQEITTRVGDTVKTMSWQMVFARNEAEFNSLWTDMVQRAKGMGVETSNEWYRNEYIRARTAGAKYIP